MNHAWKHDPTGSDVICEHCGERQKLGKHLAGPCPGDAPADFPKDEKKSKK